MMGTLRFLYSSSEIQEKEEIGERITRDYPGERASLVCRRPASGRSSWGISCAKYSLPRDHPWLDMVRIGHIPARGVASASQGTPEEGHSGRHVLVVEDIIDTGLTSPYLLRSSRAQARVPRFARSLSKPLRRRVELLDGGPRLRGPDEFVVWDTP